MSLEHILQALVAILIRPEVTSAMDHELLNNYHNYSGHYESKAKTSALNAAKKFKMWFSVTAYVCSFVAVLFGFLNLFINSKHEQPVQK